jgi:phosphoribosylcarboxyaminoimidazole (NCAIR) mutase
VNAALLAGQILGVKHPAIREAVRADRKARTAEALADQDPRKG